MHILRRLQHILLYLLQQADSFVGRSSVTGIDCCSVWPWQIQSNDQVLQVQLYIFICLMCRYPEAAWEVLLGYDQEKRMGDRAGAAAVESIKIVDQQQHSPVFNWNS